MSSVWSTLKTAYSKLVVPFEHYVNRQTVEDDASPPDLTNFFQSRPIPANTHDNLPNTPKHTSGADSLATPDSDAIHLAKRAMPVELQETVRTASDKLNEALMNSNHTGASGEHHYSFRCYHTIRPGLTLLLHSRCEYFSDARCRSGSTGRGSSWRCALSSSSSCCKVMALADE